MARKPRIHLPGGFYHVMLRGNAGQDIFLTDEDRYHFYLLMQEGVERFAHRIHAFCCMSNHIHLVIQVADISLSRIMQNLSFRHTQWMNKKQRRTGHLFQGRYKAILVDADEMDFQRGKTDTRIFGDDVFAERILADQGEEKVSISLDGCTHVVLESYELTEADLAMKGQRRKPSEARAVIGWIGRESAGFTLSEVARRFGRDIATLSLSVRRLQQRADKDEKLKNQLRHMFDKCQDIKA